MDASKSDVNAVSDELMRTPSLSRTRTALLAATAGLLLGLTPIAAPANAQSRQPGTLLYANISGPGTLDPYVSGKSNKENMGLGLAIVKKIVIEHGGEITYRETAGRPTFTIVLPRVSP